MGNPRIVLRPKQETQYDSWCCGARGWCCGAELCLIRLTEQGRSIGPIRSTGGLPIPPVLPSFVDPDDPVPPRTRSSSALYHIHLGSQTIMSPPFRHWLPILQAPFRKLPLYASFYLTRFLHHELPFYAIYLLIKFSIKQAFFFITSSPL